MLLQLHDRLNIRFSSSVFGLYYYRHDIKFNGNFPHGQWGVEGSRRAALCKKIRILCVVNFIIFFFSSNSWDFTRHLIVRQSFIVGRILREGGSLRIRGNPFPVRRGVGYRWYPAANENLYICEIRFLFFSFSFFYQIGCSWQKILSGKSNICKRIIHNSM